MISKKINLNDVEYIVRARTLVQLNDAIERIYNCDPEISRLSNELNQKLDNVLESRLSQPEETTDVSEERFFAGAIKSEPAIEKPVAKKPQPKKPVAKKPIAKKTDSSIVDLGNIGKSK